MSRQKSSFQMGLEYYPVKGLWVFLSRVPRRWAERLGYGVLRSILAVLPRRRRLLRDNLAVAFPELSSADRERIASDSLRYLAKGIAAFVQMPSYWGKGASGKIVYHDLHHLEESLRRGQGTLPFTAHYGCWELMAHSILRRYPEAAIVYRELDNPRIDQLVAGARVSVDGQLISRRHLLRQGLQRLRANGILGILIDQNFAPGGVFVDFFGRLAATTPIVSILARRTGATILPFHNRWAGDTLHIYCGAPLALSQHSNSEEAIAEDTARMTRIVEDWIREDPAQWLWLHNRWKRRPKEGERMFNGVLSRG